jgi:serine/threonine protein kinase/ankyrin repeat protein
MDAIRVISPNLIKLTNLRSYPEALVSKNSSLGSSSSLRDFPLILIDGSIVAHDKQIYGLKKIRLASYFNGGLYGFEKAIAAMQTESKFVRECVNISGMIGLYHDLARNNALKCAYLVYNLPPLGSLSQALGLAPSFAPPLSMNPSQKISILIDIVEALSYLHKNSIIHGFLTPDNVLLWDNCRAKVSDFSWLSNLEISTRNSLWETICVRYTSPEVLGYVRSSNHIPAAKEAKAVSMIPLSLTIAKDMDIYSLGALSFAMLTGKIPFANIEDPDEVVSHVINGEKLQLPYQYFDKDALQIIESFVERCVSPDPSRRPSASAETVQQLEDLYFTIENNKRCQERDKRAAKQQSIQDEVKEYDEKIQELEDILLNGRKLIKQKEINLVMIFNPKEKRDAELAIERAYEKIKTFADELEGFQADREQALEDLLELYKRQEKVEALIEQGKEGMFRARKLWSDESPDVSAQLPRYCHERDHSYILGLLSTGKSSPTGSDSIIQQSTLIRNLGELFGKELYTTIVAETTTSQQVASSTASASYSTPTKTAAGATTSTPSSSAPVTVVQPVFRPAVPLKTTAPAPTAVDSDDEDIVNRNIGRNQRASMRLSMASTHNGNSSNAKAKFQVFDSDDEDEPPAPTISSNHDHHIPSPIAAARRVIAQADSDDESEEGDESNSPAPQPYQVDSDDENDDSKYSESEEVIPSPASAISSKSIDSTPRKPPSMSSSMISNPNHGTGIRPSNLLSPIWSNPGNQITASESSLFRTSRFTFSNKQRQDSHLSRSTSFLDSNLSPEEQLEIEYLAAARGSWDEAIGMKLAGQGYDEKYIHCLAERLESPAHLAASHGHLQVFHRLIHDIGFDPWAADVRDRKPIHYAAKNGHLPVVRYLLETRSPARSLDSNPVEVPDKSGMSPLFYAVIGGHFHLVKYFLESSPADFRCLPSAIDVEYGATLLHWACVSNHQHIVEYLVDTQYVDIEARCKIDGSTVMFWACYGGSVEMIAFLCLRGAKLYPKHPPRGYTCMHMATTSGSVFKTKYLLDNGCSMTDISEDGLNPYDVATGKCQAYLKMRKEEGFLTGNILDKVNTTKK